MADLIDRDALKQHYAWWGDSEERKVFDDIVDLQPVVDAAPVVHGYWIDTGAEVDESGNHQFYCSNCQYGDIHAKGVEVGYCWHCGAKMDAKGGVEDGRSRREG